MCFCFPGFYPPRPPSLHSHTRGVPALTDSTRDTDMSSPYASDTEWLRRQEEEIQAMYVSTRDNCHFRNKLMCIVVICVVICEKKSNTWQYVHIRTVAYRYNYCIEWSLSNKAILFAKKLWPHSGGGLCWERYVNTLIVAGAKICDLIREGGLCWEWPLRGTTACMHFGASVNCNLCFQATCPGAIFRAQSPRWRCS